MTTKSKAAKPAIVNTIVAKPEHIALATKAGQSALGIKTMRDAMNDACQLLREAKAKIGDARKCELAKAFLAERFKGKAASANVKAVVLSAFRKAVESGAEYTENASRAKAKAKKAATKQDAPKEVDAIKPAEPAKAEPAKAEPAPKAVEIKVVTKPAKDDDTTIVLSLPRKSTAKQAAKQMRAFIEKMRQSDSLADLASYLTDAIAEFDGTAEQF